MAEEKNAHQGHRQRMRQKFIQNGLEGFQEHEVLEMLLFYVIPRKNTNELAHRLIDKFGSLCGVFEADVESMTEVEGVSENTAVFLKLQSSVERYYTLLKYKNNEKMHLNNRVVTPDNASVILEPLFRGLTDEALYMLALDSDCRVLTVSCIVKGGVSRASVYSRDIVKEAINTKAKYVILAHNHPNGLLLPSAEDINSSVVVKSALNFVDVSLIDHLIFADNRFVSIFRDFGVGK